MNTKKINHAFCKAVLATMPNPGKLTSTYCKIGSKKHYFVEAGSGHWKWEGVAHCSADAKYKALVFWRSLKEVRS